MATVRLEHEGDMLFGTELGRHRLVIDAPPRMGGRDRGPMPPDVFVVSLGGCVADLVVDYCNRAGLDTRGLVVQGAYESASEPTRLVDVRVKIDFPNTDIRRRENAITRVADGCPVHQTMCTLKEADIEIRGRSG